MSEQNKTIARRYCEEAINQRKLDLLDELVSDDFVFHFRGQASQIGSKGLREAISKLNAAFPDRQVLVHDVLADGDMVFIRVTVDGTNTGEFSGLPPTGKKVSWTGMELFRLADSKIIEAWASTDRLSLMQQLGVVDDQW